MEYDCQTCGACCSCFSGVVVYSAEIYKDGKIVNEILHKNVVKNNQSSYYRLEQDNFRCKHLEGVLGENVSCNIYENRPSVCRQFEPGSKKCIEARKKVLNIGE